MKAADSARRRGGETRLMVLRRDSGAWEVSRVSNLQTFLTPRDLLVMNQSGTLPASLRHPEGWELRLAAVTGESPLSLREWWAVAFGSGSWRAPTEERGSPPRFVAGQCLDFPLGLRLQVLEWAPGQPRLLRIRFAGNFLLPLYRTARPVQYSYHREDLALWDVQTAAAALPLSVEPPSALFPFRAQQLVDWRAQVSYVLHGAGLSSTGEANLDQLFPLPEYYRVPEATLQSIQRTHAAGGRVIAVGTTVARALESAAIGRNLQGYTSLKLGADSGLHLVDGLITGMHPPGTSHYGLEEAFTARAHLDRAYAAAVDAGFLGHEFGDLMLML